MRQYNRGYKLTVINPDGRTTTIDGLRINFQVTKSVRGYPNLANIKLFNLSSNTISLFLIANTKIQLQVGYDGELSTIFRGQIKSVTSQKANTDKVLEIFCSDGSQDWSNAYFNKTYTDGVSIDTIIKDVIGSFSEVTTGVLSSVPALTDKLMGQTLSAPNKDVLDMYAKEYGFDWSIQDEELTILAVGETNPAVETVIVNAATGLLGAPSVTEIGVDVTTLLNPKLLPNTRFQVTSEGANVSLGDLYFRSAKSTGISGDFKVLESKFIGDNYEGAWQSSIVGEAI